MKFIEISEGVSVRICEIESVSTGDDYLSSVVKTHYNIYRSTFPYNVLLELLEREEEPIDDVQVKQLKVLEQIGTFAG